MKIHLSPRHWLAIVLATAALGILMATPVGLARLARGANEPRVVAVNWNSSPNSLIVEP